MSYLYLCENTREKICVRKLVFKTVFKTLSLTQSLQVCEFTVRAKRDQAALTQNT